MKILFICCLSILSYVSSDVYLPAFPALQAGFATSKSMVEYSLTTYLLGLAIGQLIFGPLSDTCGRKKILIIGFMLYVFASLLCAFSPSIYVFCMGRFLQALGVSAASGLWQAIVVDSYPPGKKRDHVFSIVIPSISLSPVFSPIIGGYLTAIAGWYTVFLLLALIGVIMLTLSVFAYQETHPVHARQAFDRHYWLEKSQLLLSSRVYCGYMGGIMFASGAFFVYITEIPFVLKSLGETEKSIGYLFAPQSIAFVLGSLYSKTIAPEKKQQALRGITWIAIGASLVLVFTSYLPAYSIWQFIIPYAITAFVNGAMYPLGYALIYEAHGDMPGMVAGLSACLLAFVGFFMSGLMGLLSVYGALAMAGLILLSYMLSIGLIYVPRRVFLV
jgi:Bcr/CflA subfamily drug resistance transporter